MSNLDKIVQNVLGKMSLKEKAIIANIEENNLPDLQQVFDSSVDKQLGTDGEVAKDVIYRVWKALQVTHRIRRVK